MNPHARETVGKVRQLYDGTLEPDIQVNTCRNIDRLFPVRLIKCGDQPSPLAYDDNYELANFSFESEGKVWDLYDYLAVGRVTGLLIIQDGIIKAEKYYSGNTERTQWMSMSVAKSFSAMLVGAAVQDGLIKSIDDDLIDYLPQFKGSAYEGVTIRHLLQMTSGVGWNETYTDPNSDRRRMLEAQIGQQPNAVLDLMASLPRAAEPGTQWNYSTGETHLVGALVAAATGTHVAHYLSRKIWRPMGMEADATWWLESPDGLEVGGSGLSATLRDYGRFGLFMLNDGVAGKQRILPENWMTEAGTPKVVSGEQVNYGFMLWPQPHNAYTAAGIFGQIVYVRPAKNLVIAMWSARPKPQLPQAIDPFEFLAALSEAV